MQLGWPVNRRKRNYSRVVRKSAQNAEESTRCRDQGLPTKMRLHKNAKLQLNYYGLRDANFADYIRFCLQKWREGNFPNPDDFTPPLLPPSR